MIFEIIKFLATSSKKVACIIFISSLIVLLVPSFALPYKTAKTGYEAQISIALIVSLVWLLYTYLAELRERWKNRKGKLKIIKATYGIEKGPSIDVTDKVKALIEKDGNGDKLSFIVNDDKLLALGKTNDPSPGSDKIFVIEYSCKHKREFKQKDQVDISC